MGTRLPDPSLADRIRYAMPRDDEGAQAYRELGARLDALITPGDPSIQGWWAIPAGSIDQGASDTNDSPRAPHAPDELVAIAAVTSMRPTIPHVAPAVTLGMHAANRSARSVYSSLGYTVGHRWASGRATTEIG